MQNRFTSIVLLLGLLAAVLYSVLSLHQPNIVPTPVSTNAEGSKSDSMVMPSSLPKNTEYFATASKTTQPDRSGQTAKQMHSLPINIKLKGIALDGTRSLCLLESSGEIGEFKIGDLIYNQPIQVIEILSNSIMVGFENRSYEIMLTGPNLLEEEESLSQIDLLNMSPEQIGNRPKLIEHFVNLTPTPYIADGMLASPGINSALFAQAGLIQDDVITNINGKNITIAEEFSELQRTIRHADTLVITVMRRGRYITLYLDIPSEALTLSR